MAENKRQNLGRGLNALLGEELEAKSDSGHLKGSRLVPVERLYPGRYQPRHSIDEDLIELFGLYRADRWQVLWKLRLPHAVPYLVTGARTSSGMAVIGAIVGEFFVGHTTTHYGLGYLVLSTSQPLKTAHLFAAVIASALLGIALFGAVTWIGTRLLSRWGSATD